MANAEVMADIAMIQSISAVPKILQTVAATTGLGFVCVARVTSDSWTTCAVLDRLGYGLKVGDGLDVTTTLCEEVRDTLSPVIIDSVLDSERYRDHHTPRIYGFQSYFSIPLYRPNGDYFGTLCGLDRTAANLSNEATRSTLTLFAEMISLQLQNEETLAQARQALRGEQETAQLREQFIAVLGHDVRTPLGAILSGAQILGREALNTKCAGVVERMRSSALRISSLVDDVTDFTRGRMGGGISLNLRRENRMQAIFVQVVDELRAVFPGREIDVHIPANLALFCDAARMAQLLSNLLKNALVHGDPALPVAVAIQSAKGIFRLIVSNGGQPIPQEIMGQLFKPFWRAEAHAGKEGLGLGLFIVSEIAKSHGGRIEVASTGQVTSFTYTVHGPDFAERRVLPRPR